MSFPNSSTGGCVYIKRRASIPHPYVITHEDTWLLYGGGQIGGNLEDGGGRDEGSEGMEGRGRGEDEGSGEGGGAAGVEEDIVSGGALGSGVEGWLHRYCCTSSVPGDCGSISMDDCQLI